VLIHAATIPLAGVLCWLEPARPEQSAQVAKVAACAANERTALRRDGRAQSQPQCGARETDAPGLFHEVTRGPFAIAKLGHETAALARSRENEGVVRVRGILRMRGNDGACRLLGSALRLDCDVYCGRHAGKLRVDGPQSRELVEDAELGEPASDLVDVAHGVVSFRVYRPPKRFLNSW
jgi:hypothetical protein